MTLEKLKGHAQDIETVDMVLEPDIPGQEFQSWDQLAKWPQVSNPASLSLGFSTCKLGIVAPALKFCCKGETVFTGHTVGYLAGSGQILAPSSCRYTIANSTVCT